MSTSKSPRLANGGFNRGTSAADALTGVTTTLPPSDEYLLAWTAGYLAGSDRADLEYQAAWDAGYEQRGREVNAEYPPDKVLVFGRWYEQATERKAADAEVQRLVAEQRAA